jgi:beta-galactosidase
LVLCLPAALSADAGRGGGLTVRVDHAGGVPRIVVNGRPVRARMFFGGPGGAPIHVGPEGRRVEFEFLAEDDSKGRGTLHFRFGHSAGDVFLDGIAITDVATGGVVGGASTFEKGFDSFSKDWTFWPPGAANTVGTVGVEPGVGAQGGGGLHVALREPAGGNWPDFHIYHLPNLSLVEGRRYRVTFWAKAEPARDLEVAMYRPGDTFVRLGGPPGPFAAQIRMAAAAGVDFVSFPIEMAWPAPGAPEDFKSADRVCQQVLEANPNALLLPRFGVDPPEWWRREHPGDVMTWEDGSHQYTATPVSPVYRSEAAARVAALVSHLEAKFGDHMAGYHPCGQNTGEWFYLDTWGTLLNGYSSADTNAWRAWLRGKYGGDASLRAAWGEATATCGEAGIPTAARRRAAPHGVLRDPVAERDLIDFATFQQEGMADLVRTLAHAAREASKGRKLVTFFYGYGFEFGPIRLGPSTCGHYALRRVLECPDIDVLCSPISYFDRGLGGGAPAMSAAESVTLAGKLWLCEDDTRTHLGSGDFPGKFDGGRDRAETLELLRRDVAEEATRHQATWWMDLGMTGWFNDPALWDAMKRLEAVDRLALENPAPFRPQVAAVLDEPSMLETSAEGWKATVPGVYEARRALGRMGAPYGQYLLDDVVRGRVEARLYVFLNAWRLDAATRRDLVRAGREAWSLWCFAPGWHDGDRTSTNAMRELTGFSLAPVKPGKALATPSVRGRELGLQASIGVDGLVAPLFAAVDARPDEVLATYPDGSAAVALRRHGRGASMFVGAPGLTSELMRVAARGAGVHLYTETDCNVYANGPVLAVHGAADGAVVLDLGGGGELHDAETGALAGRGPKLAVNLKKGETRIFRK